MTPFLFWCQPGCKGVNQPQQVPGGSIVIALLLQFCVTSVAQAAKADVEATRCNDFNQHRQAYFGDLHIHTGLSADAMLFGTTNRPDDAYAFARGKSLQIKNLHFKVKGDMFAKMERPLDFAAVTDHAENMGAVSLCTNPDSPVYDIEDCQFVRRKLPNDSMAAFSSELTKVFRTMYYSNNICGDGRSECIAAAIKPWQEIQTAASQWNNACEFTTFVGYEYSQTDRGSNLHHNVIFGNQHVMERPISSRDVPKIFDFYRKLNDECNNSDSGCQAIAIPHNSNISNGKMFRLDYHELGKDKHDLAAQRAYAQLRADVVPIVESFQEKGDSECRNGLWNVLGQSDEFCDFEEYRNWRNATTQLMPELEDCESGVGHGGFQNLGCVSRLDYVRPALAAGLAEQRRLGVNSLKFGFIGSTDNHLATTGDLEEWLHDGKQRPATFVEAGRMSTGGLAGIWAEQNTRESLFAAMQRREVFATSGPRIKVRLFASEAFSPDLCESADLVSQAYQQGVTMGSDLQLDKAAAPVFLAMAEQDTGTSRNPGTPLQRLQIVKVWAGEGDELHQRVYDIAGNEKQASVNEKTCARKGSGYANLCAQWRDPDYDPAVQAAYYVRALENPSCRYTGFTCAQYAAGDAERPSYCDDETVPKTIQERAWGSPIWVSSH